MTESKLAYDPVTLRFYAEEAPVYAASGPDGRSRFLSVFLDRWPAGASILELGCGGGRDAAHMIERGFNVDATDAVPEIARQAEQRLGRAVRVMRFDELAAVESYDAIWAHASLLHVPRSALPTILSAIWRALRPGGWHFANFKGGGQEGRDSRDRYFNYVSRSQLAAAYQVAEIWEVESVSEYEGGGYDRGLGPWVALTARKPT